MATHQQNHSIPSPATVAALEKLPAAARRMGISTSQLYREIKAQRIGPLVKLSLRASALPSASVDRWIGDRIAEASSPAAMGGR